MTIEIPDELIEETITYWNDESYPLRLAKYVIEEYEKLSQLK